jgi:glyoxylase-like metal-dependent hydrolase (beta-lactamase superfamily II)
LLLIFTTPAIAPGASPIAAHGSPGAPAHAIVAQVGTAPRARDAAAWLDAALAAMGGRTRLEALRSVSSEGYGSEHALEQSERPEGPWIAGVSEFSEVFDVHGNRLARTETAHNTLAPSAQPSTTLVAGGVAARPLGDRVVPLPETFRRPLVERMELGPERLLLTAARTPADELTLDGPVLFQGVPHVRVGFSWGDLHAAIVLNTRTALPSAVELVGAYPDDSMLGVWGDMTRRIEYSYWTLESGGLRYPRQWNVYENGQQRAMRTVTALELDVAVDEATFAPLADVAAPPADAAPQPTRRTLTPFDVEEPVELAPGIVQVRSWWNTVLVDQGDAVVIIEGALSSEYSERILELVAQRFARPVRAVINTSDAWPHIGGLRAYVAHGIPVLTHPLNRPLLERLFTAPYATNPDLLQRRPRPAQTRGVGEALQLGSGANRLVVAPVGGEWSERMLMVYFPEHELLYGSDLVFPPNPPYSETYFMPIYLDELATAARREGFAPRRVIAMHAAPVAWTEILAEIDRIAR